MKYIQYLLILIVLVLLSSCFQNKSKSNYNDTPVEIEEEYLEECDECKGEGSVWVRCRNCDGSGRLTAMQSKYYACNYCIGTGKLPCETCDKYGYHHCSRCAGLGSHKCDVCGGSGQIYQSGYFLTCYKCNGDGYPPCWECSGRGKITCEECWGSRFVKCSYCNGKGHNGEYYFEEVDNGECPYCEGYRRIRVECDECEGEGQINKIRKVQLP